MSLLRGCMVLIMVAKVLINQNYFASLKTLIITRKRITSKDILPGTT